MKESTVTIQIISKSGRFPVYATDGAAGADLCAYLPEPVTLQPGERRLIPTGLFIEIPQGVEAQIRARSGLSIKHGIGLVNGVGNGQFAPNQHITRAQAAVLLNRLLGRCMAGQSYENARQYPDVPQTHWAWKNICEASDSVALR